MSSYLFILGSAYSLSRAELLQVLSQNRKTYKIIMERDPVIGITSPDTLDANMLMDRLGGTVKICSVSAETAVLDASLIASILAQDSSSHSLVFGFSAYGEQVADLVELSREVKQLLEKLSRSVRYVLPRDSTILSSVIVRKQRVRELVLFFDRQPAKWYIAKTLAVQDADKWASRDLGRPFIDPKAGMLPLKVARMMVNLAISNSKASPTLLDPFCGMGTIPGEGLMSSGDVLGSDISPGTVEKAEKNLSWLKSTHPELTRDYKFFVSDATHISKQIPEGSVDAVVTEPFMGAVFETVKGILTQKGKPVTVGMVTNTIKGLEKLYSGALRDWHKLLKPRGAVVIALPEIYWQGRVFRVKKTIDSCEKLGYTLSQGPFEYARPQAVVKRQIYVFTKRDNVKITQ